MTGDGGKAETERLKSQIAALEQLLKVQESTVVEQTGRLEKTLEKLNQRTRELESSEEALREQTKILQSILSSMSDAVLVADENGSFLVFNPEAQRLIGVGLADTAPDEWSERYGVYYTDRETPFPSSDLPLTRAIQGEETDDVELFIRNSAVPQGVFLSVSGRPVKNEADGPRRGVVVFRDITERKHAVEALRASEERSRLIVNTANDAFIAIDSEGKITDWNIEAENTFGWTRQQALRRTLDETIIPERYREAHRQGLAHFLATGEGPLMNRRFEITALHRDGYEFPVEITVSPVKLGDSYIFSAFVHDITVRRRAEEELKKTASELARSNSELEQFAYVVSHDLQEPLRMVKSFVELLARRYRGNIDTDADEFIGYIVDGADWMHTLLNDLLAYSRVGTRGKEFEWCDTSAILSRALANLKVVIEENCARVTSTDLPRVMADPTQLTQLFQNLIGNALKFQGPNPPRIHVSGEKDRRAWVFSVQDNGMGIDPESAERIFLIFQRLHSRSEFPGTGIGLAICKKIVERHGGRIWVESEPGKGATFRFSLPDGERSAPSGS